MLNNILKIKYLGNILIIIVILLRYLILCALLLICIAGIPLAMWVLIPHFNTLLTLIFLLLIGCSSVLYIGCSCEVFGKSKIYDTDLAGWCCNAWGVKNPNKKKIQAWFISCNVHYWIIPWLIYKGFSYVIEISEKKRTEIEKEEEIKIKNKKQTESKVGGVSYVE